MSAARPACAWNLRSKLAALSLSAVMRCAPNLSSIFALLLVTAMFCVAACTDEPIGRALPSRTTLSEPVLASSSEPVVLTYASSIGTRAPTLADERATAEQSSSVADVAVWDDGRIMWRRGEVIFEGHVEPARLNHLVQELHRDGVFGDGNTEYSNFGPDSSFDVVEVRLPDRKLTMASWHEGAEQNPNLVGTNLGIEVLDGRNRDAVIAATPSEYQRFRRIWSRVRTTVASWVPEQGKPYAGSFPAGRW